MTISLRPKASAQNPGAPITKEKAIEPDREKNIDAFIQRAPDGLKRVWKGKKVQISLTLDPVMLEWIDEMSGELGMTRAGFINMAISVTKKLGVRFDAQDILPKHSSTPS